MTSMQTTQKINEWLVKLRDGKTPMDKLFEKMQEIYLRRWTENFPDKKTVDLWKNGWSEAFIEEKLTFEIVKRGIENCRSMYDFPPSLTQFLKSCRGSHELEDAFHKRLEEADKAWADRTKQITDVVSKEKAEENIKKLKDMLNGVLKQV